MQGQGCVGKHSQRNLRCPCIHTARGTPIDTNIFENPNDAQVFPTRARALGLGVCNAMSRIGALLAPFLAVDLAVRGHPGIAEASFAVCCFAAAAAVVALPLETSGKALMVRAAALLLPCHGLFLWQMVGLTYWVYCCRLGKARMVRRPPAVGVCTLVSPPALHLCRWLTAIVFWDGPRGKKAA